MNKQKPSFNHGDRETRRRKAYERLGSDSVRCLLCGESDPTCLELHHVAGKNFDDEIIPLCQNHHAKISDAQKDHPSKIIGYTGTLEGIAHGLYGLAELLLLASDCLKGNQLEELLSYIAENLKRFGNHLIELATATALNNGSEVP